MFTEFLQEPNKLGRTWYGILYVLDICALLKMFNQLEANYMRPVKYVMFKKI